MIAVEGICKSYPTAEGRRHVFRDLSFVIPEGKSLGVIGGNGAGKSTLLRIIAGIDKPDRGRVVANGTTISWPVGFKAYLQDSMTGRDAVRFVCGLYANDAAIPGKLAFVESFAELERYFDRRVETYSAGMRARLAFALSMAFDFDYYLIDEVMAVGDARFRRRCRALVRQKRMRANFVVASRKMRKIRKYCDLVLFLGRHEARLYERVDDAIRAYRQEEGIGPRSGGPARRRKNAARRRRRRRSRAIDATPRPPLTSPKALSQRDSRLTRR